MKKVDKDLRNTDLVRFWVSIEKMSYYQFHKDCAYSVYIKFDDIELEKLLVEHLEDLGLDKVDSKKLNTLKISKGKTKILKISRATSRIANQFDSTFFAMENYGAESLSPSGNFDIYRYRGVGVMAMAKDGFMWDMAIKDPEIHISEIKVMIIRYLSLALGELGIVGLWGVPVEEGVVIMRPGESNFECVFIDPIRSVIISRDGTRALSEHTKFLRLDSTLKETQQMMSKEMLIGFLSTHTTYFSYRGLCSNLKYALLDLAEFAKGVIYPEENFKPRSDLQLP